MGFTIEKAINIVKLFLIHGAKKFYLNYFTYGNSFTEQTYVSKNQVKTLMKTIRKADKDYNNGLISEKEFDKYLAKGIALAFISSIEKDTNCNKGLTPIRFVADIIVGQVRTMFIMADEYSHTGDISEETVEIVEDTIYDEIASVLCHFIKDEEEIETN